MSVSKRSGEPKFPGGTVPAKKPLPTFVTFTTGAALLEELGLVDSITPDGLRYIARTDPTWPFGDKPGQMPYIVAGRTRTIETGIFLSIFREGPRRGGRGRKPPAPGCSSAGRSRGRRSNSEPREVGGA